VEHEKKVEDGWLVNEWKALKRWSAEGAGIWELLSELRSRLTLYAEYKDTYLHTITKI
jgi:hypothetical protein